MRLPSLILCALSLLGPSASAQDRPKEELSKLLTEAAAAYDARDYARSAELCVQAIEGGTRSATVAYNAACSYALLKRSDDAFKYLTLAIERGWIDLLHMQQDGDLTALRDDPRWKEAVKECEAAIDRFNKSIREPELRKELLERSQKDQEARLKSPLDWKMVLEIDAANAAFFLVQHAASDPNFQRRCLDLMTNDLELKEVDRSKLAYLTDRVLLAEGKKQLYGTQFLEMGGELKLQPLEDEANVDARRKEMGLGPLAEYEKLLKARTQRR